MTRETIYLAALLHDIGKFWQRADVSGVYASKILSANTKNNEGLYCPSFNGRYSHKHVLWTAEFLDRNKKTFEAALGTDAFESFFKASVKHHAPDKDDVFQLIVQKADHYASGADRTGDTGLKDADAENAWDSFKNVKMVSIFEGLLMDNNHLAKRRIPVKPLSLDDDHFPTLESETVKGQVTYAQLWDEFESAWTKLKDADSDAMSLAENLSFLLYRFASTVPSSTMHLPDVSLYDHLKSTGIFALCLYDYLKEQNRLDPQFKIKEDEAPVLLVGGDLSGIQNYIYDIVSTDAARNLKGRSFYLQILVENAVEIILNELELPWSSVVYASGGGFYLLVPNTEKIKQVLPVVVDRLSNHIFQEHQTSLSLNIDWQEVTQQQIMQQSSKDGIHTAWSSLSSKISKIKTQKFKSAIEHDYSFFFEPSEVGGKQQRDFITGEEFTEIEANDALKGRFGKNVFLLDDGKPIKAATQAQIELGKDLKNTQYWISSKMPIPQWKEYEHRISEFEIYNYLFSEQALKQVGHRHPDDLFIRSFEVDKSGYDQSATFLKGKRCVYGFIFYGGNDFPINEDQSPVTFDQMAEMGDGTQKLGVLRMDVDNLGSIFIAGLEDKKRTFSRYSVLSRNLDYFFKGYLNRIWEQYHRDNTFIIYSGGDDLFIVGHWSGMFQFAEKIKHDFARWVCNNPHLTISGGIAIIGGKFPISKGAEFSAAAEKKAKGHQRPGNEEKNAIALFGVPLSWDKEFPIVQSLKNEMVRLIPKKLPRGTLQKMLQYAEQSRIQAKKGGSTPWRWRMAYDFSRAADRNKDKEAKEFYDMVKMAAFTEQWAGEHISSFSPHTFLDLLETAARWAELETKD